MLTLTEPTDIRGPRHIRRQRAGAKNNECVLPAQPLLHGPRRCACETACCPAGREKASLTQVISGLGGVGKTQTALEYAYRHQQDYRYIFWVKADTHELLTSDFAAMASPLDLV